MTDLLPAELASMRHEFPQLRIWREAFLARAVRYLAQERGIHQFLDLGTGPTNNDNLRSSDGFPARLSRSTGNTEEVEHG